MAYAAFDLHDDLIAYDHNGRTVRVCRPLAECGDTAASCIIGIVNFSDDASVHADHWEYHPTGDEILCVLKGRLLAVIDRDHTTDEAVIEQGQAFIVPRASWHRLRVLEPGRLLFCTPTAGLELRPHAVENAGAEETMPVREAAFNTV